MCWSATADLTAGICVGAIGVGCVARVRRVRDLPLAALPLLLGAHQIVESVVWDSGGGAGPATTAWAVIALPLLALWVPLAVLAASPPGTRRRLAVPLVSGVATAAALSYYLATGTVTADIRGHTIGYSVHLPRPEIVVAGYLLATVGALLLAGDRTVRLLGVLVAAGAVLCALIWRLEFISTWCAFAAIVSVVMLGWVRRRTQTPGPAA
ncbi:hypothetical protein OIE71_01440 [Streptomyces sp. NBC_01725]|uniref:DUF6629 family protein n=1 Tax=unclassified Streptomyces TaxID=2593676 RepID=UPI0011C8ABE0|nr:MULTISPECIES: DUF6629 family protein [unclassified Streptomyces]TXL87871.1 hypothetical protein EW053_20910 [Streptomyces sp. IB2014 016-6]